MVKRTILYGTPDDPAAFDAHYFERHLPLVQAVPHVRAIEISKVAEVTGSVDSPWYLVAELWYDDDRALAAAVASEEGKAAGADVANFATGGVTVVRSVIDELGAPAAS
jgi:uncharacterized protein (TIGR02118 family)